ncbi:MAG: hypothetical protein MZU97_16420 [Bacillus subtilis]|nr:hypothetical protein [Bacillus subtilis]
MIKTEVELDTVMLIFKRFQAEVSGRQCHPMSSTTLWSTRLETTNSL